MPVVFCSSCKAKQIVPGAMVNLTVECKECGREFVADESARPQKKQKREITVTEPEVSPISILKAAGLIAALLAGIGLVFFVIVLIVRTPEPKPENVQKPAPKLTAAEEEAKKEEAEKAAKETSKFISGSIAVALFLLLGGVILGYLTLIVKCGIWVASDANARGMPGLGWTTLYFVFQAVGRIIVLPLGLIPSILTGGVAIPWFILAGEPIAWSGAIIYRYVRRKGKMCICANCGQKRLEYLVTCPVCSIPSPPDYD